MLLLYPSPPTPGLERHLLGSRSTLRVATVLCIPRDCTVSAPPPRPAPRRGLQPLRELCWDRLCLEFSIVLSSSVSRIYIE